ncbi:MAG: right-handed parallel beta-helix repeat-containing protein, partial [Sphingobacteriaceae bacterium]|nr:right-handed parallel beta-helix repeat-containing protein [Sphingobacteriaceae bacterium]
MNPIHITGSQVANATPPNPRDALEIVNNTVYWAINTTSTSTIQAALYFTGGTAAAPAFAYINVRNNIFEVEPITGNLPSAFRLVRFTLLEQLDSLTSTNNNYRIGGSAPPAIFRTNTPANDYATVAAWQTATGKDANSVSIDPIFVAPSLLLPTNVALDNLGIPVSYVFNDVVGLTRSTTTPDMGAYEFSGRILSQINVNILADTLIGPSRSVTASITDSLSTIAPGTARLFYKKVQQSVWRLDTVPVITGSNYQFLIDYAALGGVQLMDTIEYYVAVRNALNNVATAPMGGSGLFLSNAVPPLTTYRYQILPVVNGNYRVGVSGPADFPTLSAAANFVTTGLVTGPVNFILIDTLYSTAEVFPITFGGINGSTRNNHVRVTLDTSRASARIVGTASPALLVLDGVTNFEINGASTTASRALTLQNLSVAANTAVIQLRSTQTAPLDSVLIRNTRIIGGSNTNTSGFGIYAGGLGISTTGTGDNANRIQILNNEVINAYIGIYMRGAIATRFSNCSISNNFIGHSNANLTVNLKGIDVQNLLNSEIRGNEIFNITGTASITRSGIELGGTGSSNVRTSRNLIYDVFTPALNGANGIFVISGDGFIIDNNVIRGIRSQNGSATSQITNAFGIRLGSGSGHKVWYNTVHLFGAYTNASTVGAASAALVISSTVVTNVEIKNNVFSNTMTSVATGTRAFNAIWLPTSYVATNLDINNNAYHVANTIDHAVGRVGTLTTSPLFDDVLAWKGFTSVGAATNDLLSVPPTGKSPAPFVSNVNLTIPATTITGIESGAVAIAALGTPNTDFNNVNR